MPQLELISWFFNFTLVWFLLFLVLTILLKSNPLCTTYINVTPSSKPEPTNNWLWT